ncbi:MAG TPA: glycosyltransferase family 1 protein [Solirubrobacteraceae bacterium]
MLRVGFDVTGLPLDAGGTSCAARGLRAALQARDDVEVVPLAQPLRRATGRLARGLARELVWYPVGLPRRARAARVDVLHCPAPLAPPRRTRVPVVLTVHDVYAVERPEWFTRANALHARHVLPRAARAASVVVTSSEHSRGRIASRLAVDPDRIVVAPPGVDGRFAPGRVADGLLARIGVGERPYVLAVGTMQPRKNVRAVVAAVERLAAAGAPHHVVVAGPRGWRDEGLSGERVHVAGHVDDDELVALYRGADCLAFLSLGEGFGLPALEAMACGTPVVASDRSSLPEVVGDAGVLADPEDDAAITAALEGVLGSPDRRAELRERGLRRAQSFTWARCAQLTLGAYERAVRDTRRR